MANDKILGTSVKYPIQTDVKGQLEKVSGLENINQSINSILITPLGSAFYQEDRGSLLNSLIFEPNDNVLKSLLDYFIIDALSNWEKRIKVTDIIYENINENQMNCIIYYVIQSTALRGSYIYPFNRQIDR